MRRIIFILITGIYLVGMPPAQGKTLRVCKTCAIKDVRSGIKSASSFDTLKISSGTYFETGLVINKPLCLIGDEKTIIDSKLQGEILRIESDSVTIRGLHLKDVGVSYTKDHAAIRVVKSAYFNISENIFTNPFFGIYLEKATDGVVAKNRILGQATTEFSSGNGIQLWYCKRIKVIDNYVERVRDGIYLEFSDEVEIERNHSTRNLRYGLHFMFSNHDVYRYNVFEKNGAGVAVMFSKNIEMSNNEFRENWGAASFGLLLKEINDALIENNSFEENTVGISIEGSNRVSYRSNSFTRNGWAVKVRGACYTNRFEGNEFLHNSFDVSYNSKVNDNVFIHNYWSEYTGYDLDRNGIGDVPHRPVKLFSYIVNNTPETIILLRSLFMDIIDFSEKVSPVFTPDDLEDTEPLMKPNL